MESFLELTKADLLTIPSLGNKHVNTIDWVLFDYCGEHLQDTKIVIQLSKDDYLQLKKIKESLKKDGYMGTWKNLLKIALIKFLENERRELN